MCSILLIDIVDSASELHEFFVAEKTFSCAYVRGLLGAGAGAGMGMTFLNGDIICCQRKKTVYTLTICVRIWR